MCIKKKPYFCIVFKNKERKEHEKNDTYGLDARMRNGHDDGSETC